MLLRQALPKALGMVSEGLVPDLLVTDHLMPGLNGGELAFALKASQPDPQILIISGYAEAEGIDPGLPRLTKLFSNAELAASLSAFI